MADSPWLRACAWPEPPHPCALSSRWLQNLRDIGDPGYFNFSFSLLPVLRIYRRACVAGPGIWDQTTVQDAGGRATWRARPEPAALCVHLHPRVLVAPMPSSRMAPIPLDEEGEEDGVSGRAMHTNRPSRPSHCFTPRRSQAGFSARLKKGSLGTGVTGKMLGLSAAPRHSRLSRGEGSQSAATAGTRLCVMIGAITSALVSFDIPVQDATVGYLGRERLLWLEEV